MRSLLLAAAVAALLPSSAPAQYPASQRATLTQNIAVTRVEITYGRPVARDRALWGRLVPWDQVWHPGADSASRFTVDQDITVEGKPLPAGEYSLWMIARDGKPWTIIFSGAGRAFHRPYPGEAKDVLRVDVMPDTLSHVESMTIDFPKVFQDEAVMRIQWGTLGASVDIKAPWRRP